MQVTTQRDETSLPLIWIKISRSMERVYPIVFFDRDDTLIVDSGQTNETAQFSWTPQAKDVLRELRGLPFQIGIATNQGGVSSGKFTLEQLNRFTEFLMLQIESIVGDMSIIVVACPHTAQAECGCRKPKAGLFQYVQNLNLGEPLVFFGNTQSDISAAETFGIKGVLVAESDFLDSVRSWIRSYS